DVSNPSEISQIGSFATGGAVFAACIIENRAFLADYQRGLIVLNVSNPSSPSLIASHAGGGRASNIAVVDNTVYVAAREDGLIIFQF
ncbi:MAG: hypothetical protein JSW05_00305, partial [Candidatus Thorarchaeota archaeon]